MPPKKNVFTRSKKKKAEILLLENRLAEAKDLYQQVCNIDRQDAEAWFALGAINGQLGLLTELISCCLKVIKLQPDFAAAHFNLGKAHRELGQLEEAASCYRAALRYQPNWPQALNNLGNILHDLGDSQGAMDCYQQALTFKADYAEAHANLGNELNFLGRKEQAIESYRHALAIKPGYAMVYKNLAGALMSLGKFDDAMTCYQHLERLHPDSIDLIVAKANIHEKNGQHELAYNMILPILEKDSPSVDVAILFSKLCRYLECCDDATTLLERVLTNNDKYIGLSERINMHFQLGALYDDKENYEKAFHHFEKANSLISRPFDSEKHNAFVDSLIAIFNKEFLRSLPHATHGSSRPIFIVGMPRSGTSLVEQILSCHPQIFGAGELEDIRLIIGELTKINNSRESYPDCLKNLTSEICNQLAQAYLHQLSNLSADAKYVTDKMPSNFQHLGLIQLLFPQAHIIHCTRDPLDTCLSCYSHNFAGSHSYTYRMDSLGSYYKNYQRLMQHWHTVLDIPIMDVPYEALVADQKGGTRKMLEFCGLEWDESCLRFYENKRLVNTLSYNQVRQPIYKSSIGRWKNYECFLEPLISALEGSLGEKSEKGTD